MLFSILRPALFQIQPEQAHRLTIAVLKRWLPTVHALTDPMLAQTVAGLHFPNPVGLAAGFDKDGEVAHRLAGFGFGFAELGTLTPQPQAGNPQPRLFRLVEDHAVINRMGFNNGGQAAALARLENTVRHRPYPIGINIGANKESADRIADYVSGVRAMAPAADYLTVNISSPNTPGLRALQDKAALDDLLSAVMAERAGSGPPVFLKVAPDLLPADVDDIAEAVTRHRLDGLIVSNTTIARPALKSAHGRETGGLSGQPLRDSAQAMLIAFRRALGDTIPLIGVGGIATAEDAYARIRAGASLIQLYSALVFEGPDLPRRINQGLVRLLRRDGIQNVRDAVGVDASR